MCVYVCVYAHVWVCVHLPRPDRLMGLLTRVRATWPQVAGVWSCTAQVPASAPSPSLCRARTSGTMWQVGSPPPVHSTWRPGRLAPPRASLLCSLLFGACLTALRTLACICPQPSNPHLPHAYLTHACLIHRVVRRGHRRRGLLGPATKRAVSLTPRRILELHLWNRRLAGSVHHP